MAPEDKFAVTDLSAYARSNSVRHAVEKALTGGKGFFSNARYDREHDKYLTECRVCTITISKRMSYSNYMGEQYGFYPLSHARAHVEEFLSDPNWNEKVTKEQEAAIISAMTEVALTGTLKGAGQWAK